MSGMSETTQWVPAGRRMRRPALVVTMVMAAASLGVGTSAASPASAGRAQARTHLNKARTHLNKARSQVSKARSQVSKVQVGSAWTVQAGATCEIDSFTTHHSFSDVDGSGDQGRYRSGRGKMLTMRWTGGVASGAVFDGSWSRMTGDYAGTYSDGGHSVAATLIPFSAGGCGTALTPVFHAQMELSALVPGASDVDTASVLGVGRVEPTGTVHFYVCPGEATPCTPTSSGVVDLGWLTLGGLAGTSTSVANSARFTPAGTGSYCFLAVYSGDSRYTAASDGSVAHNCFTVATGNPGVQSKPTSAAIGIGASDADTVTVTVIGEEQVSPTGSVHFYECAGSATPCAVDNATSGGSDLGSVTLSDVLGIPTATSVPFTPEATGSYCFLAVYSGDGSYNPASDGSTTDECFTVTVDTPNLNTQPDPAYFMVGGSTKDTATVTGVSGLTPTGSVTFYVCGPEQSSTAVSCSDAGTNVGAASLSGSGDTATATSPSVTPVTAGLYCFFAVYSGDSHYSSVADGDTSNECVTVEPAGPPPTIPDD